MCLLDTRNQENYLYKWQNKTIQKVNLIINSYTELCLLEELLDEIHSTNEQTHWSQYDHSYSRRKDQISTKVTKLCCCRRKTSKTASEHTYNTEKYTMYIKTRIYLLFGIQKQNPTYPVCKQVPFITSSE